MQFAQESCGAPAGVQYLTENPFFKVGHSRELLGTWAKSYWFCAPGNLPLSIFWAELFIETEIYIRQSHCELEIMGLERGLIKVFIKN